jgi:hypothetical protein
LSLLILSIHTPILRTTAEKVKGTKEYARYEAYVAEKKKAAEVWAKK